HGSLPLPLATVIRSGKSVVGTCMATLIAWLKAGAFPMIPKWFFIACISGVFITRLSLVTPKIKLPLPVRLRQGGWQPYNPLPTHLRILLFENFREGIQLLYFDHSDLAKILPNV